MNSENNNLSKKRAALPTTQGSLNLRIEKQTEVGGVGMGVLTDGTPFLTLRGVARLCGVAHTVIRDINAEWNEDPPKGRGKVIRDLLAQRGVKSENLYMEVIERGVTTYLYSDVVSLAILEYYAFEAGANVKEEAQKNFRLLANKALRDFIYTQIGYDPKNSVPPAWKAFHDRIALAYNAVPRGYFSIFKELADMIVTFGQAGVPIDKNFVPDISVGQAWATHWNAQNLAARFGEREKYEHNYPLYFPQSVSNPQDCWCYPEQSLGDFRRWLRESYIEGGKLEKYLDSKIKQRQLPASFAQLALSP